MRNRPNQPGLGNIIGVAAVLCCNLIPQASLAQDSSHSSAPGARQLKGGASDEESMGQSVKLLVPATPPPPPPPAPRLPSPSVPLSAGVRSGVPQLTPQSMFHNSLFNQAPFQLHSQQWIQPARRVEPAKPYVNYGLYPTVVPRAQYTPVFRPAPQPLPLPPPVWRAQIDVVAVAEPYRVTEMANLETAIKRVQAVPVASTHVEAKPLQAQEMTLPGSTLPPAASWEEWYKRVAHAIYDRWSQNTAGPGAATISITVFNSHYIDCRITQFVPADGAERNPDLETKFKQTALESIKTLSGDQLWGFPIGAKASLKKIVFEMELKHAVGETAGCKVVHLHDGN